MQMAFHIKGIGYSGFSGGEAYLAFSGGLLYRAFCQGTSGCAVWTTRPFSISNDVSGGSSDSLLREFTGKVVHLKLDGAFVGQGPGAFTFEIFNENQGSSVYKVERRPQVRGVSTGSIEVTTVFRRISLSENTLPFGLGKQYQEAYDNIWAGNFQLFETD
jgi:hypothetical protein